MRHVFPTLSLHERANRVLYWHGVDCEYAYDRNGENDYSKTDITYSFNSDGYRSDEFNTISELPILFAGCSFTDGVGLPLNHAWASILLDQIKGTSQRNIPLWNVANSGNSVDEVAASIYWHMEKYNQPLKYIVMLLPPMSRRSFMLEDDSVVEWHHPEQVSESKRIVDRVFTDDHYQKHCSLHSLKLIDSVARIHNTKIVYSTWNVPGWQLGDNSTEKNLVKTNFPHWHCVPYPRVIFNTDFARDKVHPGKSMHLKIAASFWDKYFSAVQ